MNRKEFVLNAVSRKQDLVVEVSDRIFDFAETGFHEFETAKLYQQVLEKEGFAVEMGIAGMPTAFKATYGNGKPVVGFLAGTLLGTAVAVGMWWSEKLARILDPYLVVLNALPKTALGPIFIVWMGAGMGAIIVMTLAISLIVTILTMYQGFMTTDPEKLRLMRTLGASRRQILWMLVFPANLPTLFSTLKVNVGLSWVGVIMGEFLVSRAGLGYLIVYGSQVFNMDLVMTSVLILALAAVVMYQLVLRVEKILNRTWGVQS